MKMDLFGKRFALLLGLLLAISGLSACKRGEKPAGGTTEASEEVTTGGEPKPISYRDMLPDAQYDEADVNVLVMTGRSWQYGLDDAATDACSKEIISRNSRIEERYHVYLNYIPTDKGWSGFHEQCRNDLYSEQAAFDITIISVKPPAILPTSQPLTSSGWEIRTGWTAGTAVQP